MSSVKHFQSFTCSGQTRSSSSSTRLATQMNCLFLVSHILSVFTLFSPFSVLILQRLPACEQAAQALPWKNLFRKCVVTEPSQGKRKHFACCSFCKRRHLAFNDLAAQLFMLVPPFRIPCRRCLHPNFPGWFCFHLCCSSPSAHVWTIKRALGLIAYHSMSLSPPIP